MRWEEAESQGRQAVTFRLTQAKPAWGEPELRGSHHWCTMLDSRVRTQVVPGNGCPEKLCSC